MYECMYIIVYRLRVTIAYLIHRIHAQLNSNTLTHTRRNRHRHVTQTILMVVQKDQLIHRPLNVKALLVLAATTIQPTAHRQLAHALVITVTVRPHRAACHMAPLIAITLTVFKPTTVLNMRFAFLYRRIAANIHTIQANQTKKNAENLASLCIAFLFSFSFLL